MNDIGSAGSQHPLDIRIRALNDVQQAVSTFELHQIVEHVASATFSDKQWSVERRLRVEFEGERVGPTADSALFHALKHIYLDGQWAVTTRLSDYVDDVRTAVRHPDARIVVYQRWAQTTLMTLAPTVDVVPPERIGTNALPFVAVIYSADIGKISTAYMVRFETAARIPRNARWLR